MRNDLKKIITEKGQGLTEYALILAFVAGIAFVMFGSEGNLKGKLVYTFTKAVNTIGGLFDENYGYVTASQNYSTYFDNWSDKKSDYLMGISAEERLKADQEGLSLIASYFLGKDKEGVLLAMAGFANAYGNNKWMEKNLGNYNNVDENGWSDVLVPLSYKVADYDNDGYIWLEASKNSALIKEMTGENTVDIQVNGKKRTALYDRMFYSDGMIGADATDRAIAVKVHYATEGENAGKVDKVWIAAQSGVKEQQSNNDPKLSNNRGKLSPGASAIAGESKSIDGLELMVTGSSSDYQYRIN